MTAATLEDIRTTQSGRPAPVQDDSRARAAARHEDGLLVAAAAAGDARAWEQLVDRQSARLWAVARSFRLNEADAADVVQTSWLRLAEHLSRLRDVDSVGAWLSTTARREALRLARGRERCTWSDQLDLADPAPEPEDVVVSADEQLRLRRGFARLSERDQQLLTLLVASPPLNYAEISAALQMPIGSIGPTRARALKRLREELQCEGITDRS